MRLPSVDHGGTSYGGESFINLPLVDDHFALRIGGAYRYDAGYIDNIQMDRCRCGRKAPRSRPLHSRL